MANYNQNSQSATTFHDFPVPERGTTLAGYAALITGHDLSVPTPDYLCVIGTKHKKFTQGRWRYFTPRHRPDDNLYGHLIFALKHEGVELAVLKALFCEIEPATLEQSIRQEPTGAYSRRIWFLYEWLCNRELDIEDASQGNFAPLLNETLQYPGPPRNSRRHRIRNNLPGTPGFCPLIRRTEKLDHFISLNLSKTAKDRIGQTHGDLLNRAAAFLLLKDSKASYTIEGEAPPHNRLERWGRIIGEAGQRKLNIDELEYLQKIVIADKRFVTPGCRHEGGFVGDHDRVSGMPLPVHISAKAENVKPLLSALIEAGNILGKSSYDPVLAATSIAFGFVFIHPFEDGNGRIHRYLFHHLLAETSFVPKGLVFPVSAVILEHIDEYRKTLELFSKPRLDLIKWRPTDKGNIEVLNDTIDLYRYFDATKQAEFFYECVAETVQKTLPAEVGYLKKYDLLNDFIKNYIDMPDRLVDLLIRFLDQNNGKLSKRAIQKEFTLLTKLEVQNIENRYASIFNDSEDGVEPTRT